jgi:NAD dependent epimerase/dehydratase family enzyme
VSRLKILVTGAKGFIGKNLTAELRNQGYTDIYYFDRNTDEKLLDEYTKDCDFVFHLAGVNADRIYVLEGGRVVESGRHRELVAQDGVYTRIYSQQKILEGFAQNREVLSYA